MISHLESEGPLPGLEEKLSLFGRFVGDWEIVEDRFIRRDGKDDIFRGELHWGWILEGRATQDVWMMFDNGKGMMIPIGSTVRFYDEEEDDWQSIWIVPSRREVRTFRAHPLDETVMLEGRQKNGTPEHWVFYDIKPDSFKWKAEESYDNGKSWVVTEVMDIRRMKRKE